MRHCSYVATLAALGCGLAPGATIVTPVVQARAPGRQSGFSKGVTILPVSGGRITSGFGPRKRRPGAPLGIHHGIDFKVPVGTQVQATDAGTVVKAGWQSDRRRENGFGLRVILDHGNGNMSIYGHLSGVDVKAGDYVAKGEVIGVSGNTGNSSAPHLHYEERCEGHAHPPTYHPQAYRSEAAEAAARRAAKRGKRSVARAAGLHQSKPVAEDVGGGNIEW